MGACSGRSPGPAFLSRRESGWAGTRIQTRRPQRAGLRQQGRGCPCPPPSHRTCLHGVGDTQHQWPARRSSEVSIPWGAAARGWAPLALPSGRGGGHAAGGRRGAVPEQRPAPPPGRPLPAPLSAMAGPWRGLRRARGWAALAGLRARTDKFGGVSVDLGELRGSPRLERAAFGRWLRGKCRAGVPSAGAGRGR